LPALKTRRKLVTPTPLFRLAHETISTKP